MANSLENLQLAASRVLKLMNLSLVPR